MGIDRWGGWSFFKYSFVVLSLFTPMEMEIFSILGEVVKRAGKPTPLSMAPTGPIMLSYLSNKGRVPKDKWPTC